MMLCDVVLCCVMLCDVVQCFVVLFDDVLCATVVLCYCYTTTLVGLRVVMLMHDSQLLKI